MRLFSCLLALSLCVFSLSVRAEQVSALYQVREPVQSQQPDERNQALQQAFDTLILRLTGDSNAVQSSALAELRKDPQQLVSRYGYEGDNLVVDFDPLTTERSLRQAGLALWGSNRPLVLTWWLNEGDGSAVLVSDAQEGAQTLQGAAQHRGLPLRLPLGDLDEQLAATPENLTANQPDALQPASVRYAADAMLGVYARQTDGRWQAQWQLWLGDGREQGNASAADSAALADAVLLAVSQRMAPRFVVAPGAAEDLTLVVQGADLARYAELSRLLEPFAARLLKVQGDSLTYQVAASADQLRAQLALARMQEVTSQALVDPAPTTTEQPVPEAPAVPDANVLTFSW